MQKPDLSIVIISYNTNQILVECINSILETVKKNLYEIIVVDNNSQDGTVEEMRKMVTKFKNLKLIENKDNLGFSKANNIGIKESSGRYILFLNSDTVVYPNTVDGMIEFMDNEKDAGASTCFVELLNGRLDDAAHRGFPTPYRAFWHFSGLTKIFPKSKLISGYSLGYLDLSKIHEVDACAGAFMLVRREAGEEVGWWDEDFFWYGEDVDFCYRLKEKKWKIYFVPNFRILHYKGVSGGIKKISKHLSKADKETRERAIDARFNAMRIFYDKHYKNKYPGFLNLIVLSGINMRRYATKILNRI